MSDLVVWHDTECGRYTVDLPFWREMARQLGGPVLDLGCGTGRVTLDLAAALGVYVVGLDREAQFLAALNARARRLGLDTVETVEADAADFDLGEQRFALIIAPMQTVQLLPKPGRPSFFRSVRHHLRPGGMLAMAIADPEDTQPDAEYSAPPKPDIAQHDGRTFVSQPTSVRIDDENGTWLIERFRTIREPNGLEHTEADLVELTIVRADELIAEGAGAGLVYEGLATIPATPEHVGSQVVVLRG